MTSQIWGPISQRIVVSGAKVDVVVEEKSSKRFMVVQLCKSVDLVLVV